MVLYSQLVCGGMFDTESSLQLCQGQVHHDQQDSYARGGVGRGERPEGDRQH